VNYHPWQQGEVGLPQITEDQVDQDQDLDPALLLPLLLVVSVLREAVLGHQRGTDHQKGIDLLEEEGLEEEEEEVEEMMVVVRYMYLICHQELEMKIFTVVFLNMERC